MSSPKAGRPFTDSAVRSIRANGVTFFVREILRRTMIVIRRSLIFRRIKSAGLTLGPRCNLRGLAYIKIGKNFRVMEGLWLEAHDRYKDQELNPRVIIGDDVSVSRWCHVSAIEYIEIGSRTLLGSNVYIADHNHGTYAGIEQSDPNVPPATRPLGGGGPVIIGEDVWIGNNAVLVGPLNVGRGAIIAANSVVTRDVSVNTIVAGVPARPIKGFSAASGEWEAI